MIRKQDTLNGDYLSWHSSKIPLYIAYIVNALIIFQKYTQLKMQIDHNQDLSDTVVADPVHIYQLALLTH